MLYYSCFGTFNSIIGLCLFVTMVDACQMIHQNAERRRRRERPAIDRRHLLPAGERHMPAVNLDLAEQPIAVLEKCLL